EFDHEVGTIRAALAAVPPATPMMDAIRQAVVAANHYRAEDVPELRARMNLIGTEPALVSSAAPHYDAWERAISDFVASRTGRAAYDRWADRADADLTLYLNAALTALAAGFAPDALRAAPPWTTDGCL